tara:strand:- start:513 stop:755 length:243 start_codon:yes stop_codon:yes gene_type:complete
MMRWARAIITRRLLVDINGNHPFWGIIRLVVMFAGLTTFLYLNSTNFDKGEVLTIVELLILACGFEAGRKVFQSASKKKE